MSALQSGAQCTHSNDGMFNGQGNSSLNLGLALELNTSQSGLLEEEDDIFVESSFLSFVVGFSYSHLPI